MSTPPDTLHMNQNIKKKNIKLVLVQNWHRQNNLKMRYSLFLHQIDEREKFLSFFFKKVFFTIVDLGKSKHSELFGPHFWRQKFFPRSAPGVLWAPPGGPLGIFLTSTPSDSLQMEHVSQEKYIILVSFQNWHWQNNLNPRHILFSHKN